MSRLDMAFAKALQPLTLVMFFSWMVSGAQHDMFITRGDMAVITCPFGDGVMRNISWRFNNGTGYQLILNLFQGHLTIDQAYADRVGLHDDNTTIFLSNTIVKDEGVYQCDVERQDSSQAINIATKLKVYGLAPNISPTIRQCPRRLSNCSSTKLTCTLRHIYPTTNASLNWYHERRGPLQGASSISGQAEDGTFDLTSSLEASETGNWTCNATYLSIDGIKHTSTTISVSISDDTDDKDSPVNLVYIIVPIVVVIAVVVGIVIFILIRNKRAKRRYGKVRKAEKVELGAKYTAAIEDEILANLAEALQDEDVSKLGRNLGFRQFKLNQVIKENERANDVFATTSMLFDWKKKTPAAKQITTIVKVLSQSDLEHLIIQFFPNEAGVSDEKLEELAESLGDDDGIAQLGVNFGFRQFKVNQYIKSNKDHGDHSGTLAMLKEWRKKTPRTRQIPELVETLKDCNLDTSSNIN